MSIKIQLQSTGLGERESLAYLTLLRYGKMSPAVLAGRTGVHRATMYNVLEALKSYGLVVIDPTEKKKMYSALPPENLRSMTDSATREIEEKKKKIEDTIAKLEAMTAEKTYPVPKIRFVQEGEVEKFLYANVEKWTKSAKEFDNAFWGIQDEAFLNRYRKFIEWYWKQPLSRGIQMKQIGNDSLIEGILKRQIKNPVRDVRLIPDFPVTASIWICGEYMILLVSENAPVYLVEISDRTLAQNMRETFKKLWKEMPKSK